MDANKLIEEAEMLCSVASAAPWRCEHGRGRFEIKSGAVSLAGVLYEQDRDFIVGARMLVPALTAALKASEERARKADELAAANLAANKRIVELEHERDSARAELARLTTPRPIADAPRDGTNILGVWLTSSAPEVMHWDGSYWTDEGEELVYKPTHYLPLPEVKP